MLKTDYKCKCKKCGHEFISHGLPAKCKCGEILHDYKKI